MPVIHNEKECYFQWGKMGTKYHYLEGNNISKGMAKSKAEKQGKAIHASKNRVTKRG